MSDIAQEMIDFAEPVHRMTRLVAPSKVLIGGLGLGYIAHWAHRLGHDVDVVEKELDIIQLTGKYLPTGVKVINADLNEFLKVCDVRQYRFAIFDTWYGTSESTYWAEVVPLRRAWLKAKGNPSRLWCWKEMDEMWTQVHQSALLTWMWMQQHPDFKVSNQWTPNRIFLEGLYAEFPKADECLIQSFANIYTRGLGETKTRARRWEKLWGWRWDAAIQEAEEERNAKDQAAQNTAG
jgi:hypothetical protein